ncbi:hypothetical protein [Paraburkholderia silvatlantica]|uniref:hypothetical protein n=1 Tax=Paraburkholderia silvatlantica TaxID=321895 RepID=UPI00374FF684
MASAGSLIFELAADVAHLRTDMKQASDVMNDSLSKIARNSAISAATAGYEFAMGFARSFADQVAKAVDEADAIGKLAQRIGTTTELLSAMQYAGEFAGVSVDDMALAFKGLNKAMVDAQDPASVTAEAIRAIGLDVDSLRAMDPAQAMSAIADAFAGYKDGAEKAAIATELFGKSGQVLIPLLNDGADGIAEATKEAEQLGLIVSDQTAKAMADLNDDLDRLGKLSQGAAQTLAIELAPAMDTLTRALVEAGKEGGGFRSVVQWIGKDLANLVVNLTFAAGKVSNFLKEVSEASSAAKKFFTGDFEGAKGAWNDYVKNAQEREADLNRTTENTRYKMSELGRAEDEAWAAIAKRAEESGKQQISYTGKVDGTTKKVKAAKQAVDEYQKMLDSLNESLRVTVANGDQMQTLLTDPKFLSFTKEQQATLQQVLQKQLDVKATQEAAKKAQDDLGRAAQDAQKELDNSVKSLQDWSNSQLDAIDPTREYVRTVENLIAAQNEEMITADQAAKIREAAAKKMQDTIDGMDPIKQQTAELVKAIDGFGKKASDALVDFMFASDKTAQSFSEMISSMLKDLAKMLVYKNVFEPLFGMIGSGVSGSSAGSFLGSLFGGAKLAERRMAGGNVNPGNLYRVNETPLKSEYFVPNSGGRVVTSGTGNDNVSVQINFYGGNQTTDVQADNAQATELAKRIAAVTRQVIATEKRTGGLLASS